MDTATLPGYARAGQYQSMPSFTPSLRKDGLNHNVLVLLNNFRIGLLGSLWQSTNLIHRFCRETLNKRADRPRMGRELLRTEGPRVGRGTVFLVPTLKPGGVVIMDNAGSHKGAAAR